MKIGDSISNYYRAQSSGQTSGAASASLSLDADSGSQRTQAPTVSISGSGSSASLSSALWLSMADKLESDTGAISEAPKESSAADEFMEWSDMSLAEKIRAQLLADKDLTEEDLQAMDADARAAIEAEIKEAIKRQLEIPENGGTAQAETAGAELKA
ncbi:hypothetical protein [Rhizobium herbae]|uniref:Uncharacterized protein n=1 Tax=Rhizobium herbae TaxID=508661 RepID=A0ABS4EP49_9HYPH|nr:hypothetical protein [Rhizobium herbae]MBP1859723.1 hypothetical protein [Rhizobium herbae]